MKSVVTESDSEIAADEKQAGSTRRALGSLALSMLLSSLGTSIAIVALPTLAQAFGASFQQVQWIVIAYLLAITVIIVGAGRVGDMLGHRRVLLAGIALFTLASILCGVAPTLQLLIAARLVQGLGAAILMALTVALVRETVAKERTGSAMGLLGTMSAIGTALGPSLGGMLIAGAGWRAIFLIMVPLGVVNYLLAYHYLPVRKQRATTDRNGFDKTGTLLLGLTLTAYTLCVTLGDGRFDKLNAALLLAALLGGGLFVITEASVKSPLIRLSALRDATLSAGLAANTLVATVMMATLVVGPFYLSRVLGLNEAVVGLVMSIGPLMSMLSGVPAGRLVDRIGAPVTIIVGLVAMAVGSFALAVLPSMSGLAGYIAAIAILTPGYQLFQAANNTSVMIDVPSDQRGVISGMLSLSRNLGLISGAAVMGALFAFSSAANDIPLASAEAVASGMRITFLVAGVLIIIAQGIALWSHRLTRPTAD